MGDLVTRVIGLVKDPRGYWSDRASEPEELTSILIPHLLILAGIPALASFLGIFLALVSVSVLSGLGAGVTAMILTYILFLACWFGLGVAINLLAKPFGQDKNLGRALKLAAGAITPLYVVGALFLIPLPGLWWLFILGGVGYGFWVLALGFQAFFEMAQKKAMIYSVIAMGILLHLVAIVWTLNSCTAGCCALSALRAASPTRQALRSLSIPDPGQVAPEVVCFVTRSYDRCRASRAVLWAELSRLPWRRSWRLRRSVFGSRDRARPIPPYRIRRGRSWSHRLVCQTTRPIQPIKYTWKDVPRHVASEQQVEVTIVRAHPLNASRDDHLVDCGRHRLVGRGHIGERCELVLRTHNPQQPASDLTELAAEVLAAFWPKETIELDPVG
jgi:hypothetical protein